MKNFLAILLALAMIASVAPVAFAAETPTGAYEQPGFTTGNVYVQDEDDDFEEKASLAPGETGYVYIAAYERNNSTYEFLEEEPKSISVEEQVIYEDGDRDDGDEEDEVKLISVEKKAERKKIDDGEYGWFAKIKVKSVKMSSYPEYGYDVDDLVLEYSWDGENCEITVALDSICYEDADEELGEDPKLFSYEKEDDVDITLPDDDGTFTGVARKDFDIVASMDTKVSNSLINKYPNADFRFYNGNGAKFPITKGKLTINGDSNEYCYEVVNGEYVDLTDTYDSKEKGFVISTTTLGKYVVSDMPLSGAVSSGSTATPAPVEPAPSAPTTTYPVTSPIISNPNTGVWEG